jgi:hypothetical protein
MGGKQNGADQNSMKKHKQVEKKNQGEVLDESSYL